MGRDGAVAAFLDAANDANLEGALGGVICMDRADEELEVVGGGELGVVRAREADHDNGGVTPAVSSFCAPLAKDASGFVCDLLASDNRWRAERGTDGVGSSVGASGAPRQPVNT
jgi:hypothetical protein